ncbi:MAG: cadherin-like beta sandwich domain-containing protein [Acutalibacteraceae bacterium]
MRPSCCWAACRCSALAAEGGWFYLAADWNGTLLIAPERISYTADQTLYEALNASGHSFGPDENSVTKIDGKTGNFIRSDEIGSHDLTRNAAQAGIRYLCFTDRLTAQPSDAMQSLIAAMADYRLEEPDVQLAAQAAYNAACAGYVTADDNAALSLYTALHNAVEQYKQTLDGPKYNVTFSDRNSVWQSGDTLYAQNQYGRVYQNENGSGMLSLPAGSYTFTMQAQSGGVTGSVTVPEQTSVTAVLDRTDWLKADGFMLSSASKTEFDGSKLPVEKKTARELTAVLTTALPERSTRSGRMTRVCFRMQSKLEADRNLYPGGRHGAAAGRTGAEIQNQRRGRRACHRYAGQYRRVPRRHAGRAGHDAVSGLYAHHPPCPDAEAAARDGGIRAPAALESFDESTRTYTWQVLSKQVTLALTPTAEGYTLFADGEDVTQTGGCTLSIDETEKSVSIEVRAGGEATQYTLVLEKQTAVPFAFRSNPQMLT